jgi:DNA gyrase inhibitor GyrI
MTMPPLTVELITLEPMRVVSARAFGVAPEQAAWATLLAWVRSHRLEGELSQHRFLGFNNPDPVPGKAEYGYEQWMTIGPDACSSEGVSIKRFPGGRFLATSCSGLAQLRPCWQELFTWCEHCPHTPDFDRQYLEECLTPLATRPEDFLFRLCLPVQAAAHRERAPHAA